MPTERNISAAAAKQKKTSAPTAAMRTFIMSYVTGKKLSDKPMHG